MNQILNSRFFYFLLVLVFFNSCQQEQTSDYAIIHGKFPGRAAAVIRLFELTPELLMPVDSTETNQEGDFQFLVNCQDKAFFLIQAEENQKIPLSLSPNDTVTIAFDTSAFYQKISISGNPECRLIEDYLSHTAQNERILDSLSRIFRESRQLDHFYLIKEELDSALLQLVGEQASFTRKLLRKHPGNFASLLILNQPFAREMIISPEKDFQILKQIDTCLFTKFPQNSHVSYHHQRVLALAKKIEKQQNAEARLRPGQPIPDIVLPDENGKVRTLSELSGQQVILFFWASWSPESRAAIQQLKALLKNPKQQNTQIFAVSLDHNRKFWKAALAIEKMPWVNVCDEKGMSSPLVQSFNLNQKLPLYFLIDESGKIIKSSMAFGDIREATINYQP